MLENLESYYLKVCKIKENKKTDQRNLQSFRISTAVKDGSEVEGELMKILCEVKQSKHKSSRYKTKIVIIRSSYYKICVHCNTNNIWRRMMQQFSEQKD